MALTTLAAFGAPAVGNLLGGLLGGSRGYSGKEYADLFGQNLDKFQKMFPKLDLSGAYAAGKQDIYAGARQGLAAKQQAFRNMLGSRVFSTAEAGAGTLARRQAAGDTARLGLDIRQRGAQFEQSRMAAAIQAALGLTGGMAGVEAARKPHPVGQFFGEAGDAAGLYGLLKTMGYLKG